MEKLIKIKHGKPCDIFDLKKETLANFKSKFNQVKKSRSNIYKESVQNIFKCPICKKQIAEDNKKYIIYNAIYTLCSNCDHFFVSNRLSDHDIEEFYKNDTSYAKEYTKKSNSTSRVVNVASGKVDYILEVYRDYYDKDPLNVIDVGAGAGHFVKSCIERKIDCIGVELNEDCIDFANKDFSIKLIKGLENLDSCERFDVITLWGVIEHVPDPESLLNACKKLLSQTGMIILSSPNFNSLSTALQLSKNASIVRHLDPLGHIHVFSESSMNYLVSKCGLKTKYVWYFGMDAYELIVQFSQLMGKYYNLDDIINDKFKLFWQNIQSFIDNKNLSDTFVCACFKE